MPLSETTTGTSSNPLQRVIDGLDTYIKDPASATKKTFVAIKKELMDVKQFMDGDDEDENTSHNTSHGSSHEGNPGLVITIGRAKEGKR